MTFSLVTGGATRRAVRKHRAPKGALRRLSPKVREHESVVRKHRAPKGALRLTICEVKAEHWLRQKAPSAKRCIKTRGSCDCSSQLPGVREHRAPKGALRPWWRYLSRWGWGWVRKHQAPKGALRLDGLNSIALRLDGQKAPSAIRCIKTKCVCSRTSPPGMSESTKRHKVH